jgi:hypothetical protein
MRIEEILDHIVVIEVYVLLTILVFRQIFVLGFNEYIIGDFGDAWQFVWNFWWTKNSILEGKWEFPFYTQMQFYPIGTDLIFHTFSLANNLIALPLTYFLNLIGTYNTLILLSFVLAGYFMFLLVNHLTKNKMISFIAGFAYAFTPYHVGKAIAYLNLASIQWIPLCFLFILKATEDNTMKLRRILITSFVLSILFLTEGQLFLYTSIFVILWVVFKTILIVRKNSPKAKTKNLANFWTKILLSFFFATLLISPFVFFGIRKIYTSEYTKKSFDFQTIDVVSYLFPSPFSVISVLLPIRTLYAQFSPIFWLTDSVVTIGYSILFLNFLLLRKNKDYFTLFLLLSTVFFFFLSLGVNPQFLGYKFYFFLNDILYKTIPILTLIGNPSRAAIMVSFTTILTFGLALQRWAKKKWILFLVFAVLFVEFFPMNFNFFYKIEVPSLVKRWKMAGNFTVLNIPFTPDAYHLINTHSLYFQTIHQKPIIDGFVSMVTLTPKTTENLQLIMNLVESKNIDNLDSLFKNLQIKYVILHKTFSTHPFYEKQKKLTSLLNFTLVYKSPSLEIYEFLNAS